ncbi:hypothetical protein BDW22DRAFT_1354346 [Trametopsis cervina]|nr:hypothetical protein BDW22DRAFT_1354346 [Trametopsis cervina]
MASQPPSTLPSPGLPTDSSASLSASSAPVASATTTATQPPSAPIVLAASTSTTTTAPQDASPTSTPQATNHPCRSSWNG